MEIIPVTFLHIPEIQDIAARTWPAAYDAILEQKQIDYMLDLFYNEEALLRQMATGHQFLLLMDGEAHVGFADYEFNYEADTAKLQKLYVLPQTQGTGAGKMLLDAVIIAAQNAGQQRIILNVNKQNKAQDFYKKHGFSIIREEDIDIGEDFFMNDYIMERKLDIGL